MKSWEWGPDLIELVSLKEEMPENSLPLSPCSHIMWAHSQMAATYKPRQEASEWNLPRCFKSRRRCREVRWGDRLPPLPVYQKLTKIWNNSYRATFKQQQKTPGLQKDKLISLEWEIKSTLQSNYSSIKMNKLKKEISSWEQKKKSIHPSWSSGFSLSL